MARRRRKTRAGRLVGRLLTALLALPALYLTAALIGSLVPVNRGWQEPAQGTTIYIADNGIHADIIMPVKADGLDWAPLVPKSDFAAADPNAQWIAFGSGEERVYLNTPTWWDITPRTIWSALTGGNRVMHVEYVQSPSYASARDPPEARGVSAPVGGDPCRLPARRSREAAAFGASGLRMLRRVLPGDGQSERSSHVQLLGRGPAAARRGEGERVAPVRPWPGLAIPEILSGPGRWQRAALTEGGRSPAPRPLHHSLFGEWSPLPASGEDEL